jgi:hypothetical protein
LESKGYFWIIQPVGKKLGLDTLKNGIISSTCLEWKGYSWIIQPVGKKLGLDTLKIGIISSTCLESKGYSWIIQPVNKSLYGQQDIPAMNNITKLRMYILIFSESIYCFNVLSLALCSHEG